MERYFCFKESKGEINIYGKNFKKDIINNLIAERVIKLRAKKTTWACPVISQGLDQKNIT
jgi:hypothetical protein